MEVETALSNYEKERVVYFDILNVLAIIAVIAMHCNSIVHENPYIRAWNSSLLVECLCYWAVPVFLMLSGATLMNYREKYDTKTFFKKRFSKILMPFIIFALAALLWKIFTKQFELEQVLGIRKIINIIMNNQEAGAYYFIFEILGIYLTMPLLSLLPKAENRKTLWLIVLLYFIFNATLNNLLPIIGIQYNNRLTIQIGNYVIYVFLGYLLSTQDLTKKQKILLYVSALIGVIFRYVTTFIWSKASGEVVRTTWGYCQWHTILLASAVFVFVKNLKTNEKIKNNEKLSKILKQIANCSFGIYLIHLFFVYYELQIFNIDKHTWQWRTIGIITTYLISLAAVYILKKIPILKRLVP